VQFVEWLLEAILQNCEAVLFVHREQLLLDVVQFLVIDWLVAQHDRRYVLAYGHRQAIVVLDSDHDRDTQVPPIQYDVREKSSHSMLLQEDGHVINDDKVVRWLMFTIAVVTARFIHHIKNSFKIGMRELIVQLVLLDVAKGVLLHGLATVLRHEDEDVIEHLVVHLARCQCRYHVRCLSRSWLPNKHREEGPVLKGISGALR